MGWKSMAVGGWIGWVFGGPLGALFGAAFGHNIAKRIGDSRQSPLPDPQSREMIFLASAAAMMAKLAKADGHVTEPEIKSVEAAFARLRFSPEARRYAVGVFRRAKDDKHTIYEYAYEFSDVVRSVEIRELFYELLWDVAVADGRVNPNELLILRQITHALRVRSDWFEIFRRERLGSDPRSETPRPDQLTAAYQLLGASASVSDEELRKLYREKAKKCHPDVLRAQGLPDEMIGKATDMMAKVNAAWDVIRNARGIS